MGKNFNRKIVVIGLDGATFDIFTPLLKEGKLPNLEGLIKKGVSGELESTIPPVTGPAWTSFITGKNPGKHGIYSFHKKFIGRYERKLINSKLIGSKTLWRLLSENNHKIGIFNVPVTYPPEKVNGFIVCGPFLTPLQSTNYTYPAHLSMEIEQITSLNELEVPWTEFEGDIEGLLAAINVSMEKTLKTTKYLMEKGDWEFFMTVFQETDRIQHALWEYILPNRKYSIKEERIHRMILEFYQRLDECIGEILKIAGEDSTIFIVSDHGFGPLDKIFYIGKWLEKEGFLKLKGRNRHRLINFLIKHDIFKLRKKGQIRRIIQRNDWVQVYGIDWAKTRAYVFNDSSGIHINLMGREPKGIVKPGREYEELREEITARLKELVDPVDNEKILTEVYKREDLYFGPFLDEAPDIILSIKNRSYRVKGGLEKQAKSIKSFFEDPDWKSGSGTHRMNGIFMMKGHGIKKGIRLKGTKITDIPSTILYLMGIKISKDSDGQVIRDALDSGS